MNHTGIPFGRLKSAAAVLITLACVLPVSADSGLLGQVLTGGTLTLDFGDPSKGAPATTLDRLDVLTWSGGVGGSRWPKPCVSGRSQFRLLRRTGRLFWTIAVHRERDPL